MGPLSYAAHGEPRAKIVVVAGHSGTWYNIHMVVKVVVPRLTFDVKMTSNPDGWVTVECPNLPGCISQGRTRREAIRNIREAIHAWLEAEQEAQRRGWKPVWERRSR